MASVVVNGDTSGAVTLSAPAVAGTVTVTLPSTTGTMAVLPTATGVLAESAGGTGTTTGYYGFKNRIINGAMVIDQRNAGASVTPTDISSRTFVLDRFATFGSAASKFSVQQNAGNLTGTNLPIGFTNYLGITSLAATSVGSTDQYTLSQIIEGFNVADLGWGTANAQTVTLSFWVRSSLTGTFGGVFTNASLARGYGFTYTINSANTWEQKTITVAGDTSGTWVTNNGIGVLVYWGLGVGSTLSVTAGAWTAGSYRSVTGATSVVGTNGATFYITGVQLEKGSTATSFDYRPYGTELALCQRYAVVWKSTRAFAAFSVGRASTSSTGQFFVTGTFRSSPSFTFSGTLLGNGVSANGTVSSITTIDLGPTGITFIIITNAVMTAGQAIGLIDGGSNDASITISAEL